MKPLTFISLFAGIGGIDLGLERAGMQCVAQVEIDDYATKVLAKHWPNTLRFSDVRTAGAHNLPAADLICGGFPCQDISNAGKRAGIDGERSGLWSEYARIVREIRPRYVLVENVAALLRRGIDRVLGDLAALGYDCEWQCLYAASVGAPHLRERVFILAYPARERRQQQSRSSAGALVQDGYEINERWASFASWQSTSVSAGDRAWPLADANDEWQQQSQGTISQERRWSSDSRSQAYASDADRKGLAQRKGIIGDAREELAAFERDRSTGAGQWASEPAVGRVADGLPHRMDRLRGLGNAVVPDCAEFFGRCIVAHAEMI